MNNVLYIQREEYPQWWAQLEQECHAGHDVTLCVLPGFVWHGAPAGCKVLRMVGDCAGSYELPDPADYARVVDA